MPDACPAFLVLQVLYRFVYLKDKIRVCDTVIEKAKRKVLIITG